MHAAIWTRSAEKHLREWDEAVKQAIGKKRTGHDRRTALGTLTWAA